MVDGERNRIRDAAVQLKLKATQHTKELEEIEKVLAKSLYRLGSLVAWLLSTPDSEIASNRVLYIVSWLYKSMKMSHEYSGIGRDPII